MITTEAKTKIRTNKRKREKSVSLAPPPVKKKRTDPRKSDHMRTYPEILDLQIAAHDKDWTPGERAALKALAAQAASIYWKMAKRETQNLNAFKTAVKAIAKTRRSTAPRVINMANAQFALQLIRELEIER